MSRYAAKARKRVLRVFLAPKLVSYFRCTFIRLHLHQLQVNFAITFREEILMVRRTHSLFVLLFICVCSFSCFGQEKPLRPVHTFSIVAFDPQTGQMGVAVQSHWFAVGGEVPWAEAGVGAVATQSFIDPSYGPLGLNLMRAGKSAPDALSGLLIADEACSVRQVAMVDTQGRVATFTGAKDIEPAGGIAGASTGSPAAIQCGGQPGGTIQVGKNYAVQA